MFRKIPFPLQNLRFLVWVFQSIRRTKLGNKTWFFLSNIMRMILVSLHSWYSISTVWFAIPDSFTRLFSVCFFFYFLGFISLFSLFFFYYYCEDLLLRAFQVLGISSHCKCCFFSFSFLFFFPFKIFFNLISTRIAPKIVHRFRM